LEWGERLEFLASIGKPKEPPEIYSDLRNTWDAYNFLLQTRQSDNFSVEQWDFVLKRFRIDDFKHFLGIVQRLESVRANWNKDAEKKKKAGERVGRNSNRN
jgi:hypothetical protein